MTKDKDPLGAAAAWGSELGGDEGGRKTVDREMLRRAMAINPAMREAAGNTNALLNQLQAATPAAADAKKAAPANNGKKGSDLYEDIVLIRQKHKAEHTRLQGELAKLQAEVAKLQQAQKALGPASLEQVLAAVLQRDPSMSGLQTPEILTMEQAFLSEVGFSVQKVMERRAKKR